MRVGYYYTYWPEDPTGRKPYWDEVKGYVNLYADWELGADLPLLIGKKLWVDLGMYGKDKETEEYVRLVIRAIKRKWRKIIALEMRDEPPWSRAKTQAKALMVKRIIKEEGLDPKPVGATYHKGHILEGERGEAWKASALDYIGLEAYLDYIPGESGAGAAMRMTAYIKKLLEKIGPAKKVILVGQSYDRNHTWLNADTLVTIQKPIFDAAHDLGARLICLLLFAYARPGGAQQYKAMKAEQKRLIKG